MQRAAASQKRINEFLDTKSEVVSASVQAFEFNGQIEFDRVSFVYPDSGIKALDNISFKINPGENWAIVGRTGSGKSTIADLLVRMYDVTEGTIRIDGLPINEISLDSVRKQIGYVPQDVFLFSDTVSNNILFGSAEMDGEEAPKAAKSASVHDEILQLPKKYETILGERGVTLSGGQKQRISIARAFTKNPNIVLMDDCLSAVDAKTEKAILYQLKTILKGKTAIIITHRIFSLLEFDYVIVLDQGSILEQGKHSQLLEKKGLYFELFERQKQEEKVLD